MNEESVSTVLTGTVVWFNYKTGYGYIKPDDTTIGNGKDIFVHHKGIDDSLAVPSKKEGKPPFKKLRKEQRVSFQLGTNESGQVAINVKNA